MTLRIHALLLLASCTTCFSQSTVDCIIDNFQKSGNIYSFDVRANQTSGPTFNVGTSTLRIRANPAAFTYREGGTGILIGTVSLTNINPRYSGGWTVGDGNYRRMTRTLGTFSGSPAYCQVEVNIVHWDGYPSSELLPNERFCTVLMQIYDSSQTTGITWWNSTGLIALPPGSATTTYVGGDNSTLPVTLSSFNVNAAGGAAELTWTTLSEVNSYGFHVQRGSSREQLSDAENGFVAGHGTTLEHHNYSWRDVSPAPYYRLRQVDLDGTSHYSDVVAFAIAARNREPEQPAECALLQNYPNPFNPSTTITFTLPAPSLVKMSVYDILGSEVSVLANGRWDAGVHEVRFDASGLSSGVYLCRLHVRGLDSASPRDSKGGAGEYVQTKRLMFLR